MKKKLKNRPQLILALLEKHLGAHKEVIRAVETIRETPEILEALLGELNAAILMFNRMKNEKLLINAEKLMDIMGKDDLPDAFQIIERLDESKRKDLQKTLITLFTEMNKFQFLDEKTKEVILIGRILVALYRTYMLQNLPELRKKDAQVASTLEEMLAIMALKGFGTHLFQATKHWILDWKREGFSKDLAEKLPSFEK